MSIGYVCLLDMDKTHLVNKNYQIVVSYEDDINDIFYDENASIIFLISCFQPYRIKALIYNELNVHIEIENDYDYFKANINIIKNIFNKFIPNTITSGLKITSKITKMELEYVSNILFLLSTKRIINTITWEKIGNCLYNIHNSDEVLLQKWIQVSNIRCDNKIEKTCSNLWNNYVYNGYSIETLIDWVKEENKIEYQSIYDQYIFNLVKDYAEQGKLRDYDIVQMFQQIYKNQYVNVKREGTYIWYQYKFRRWIRLRNIGIIRNTFSNEFKNLFENLIEYYYNEISIVDNIHFNNIAKIISNIKKVCKRLSNTNKKKIFISKCKIKFQISDEEFQIRLNAINNIIID